MGIAAGLGENAKYKVVARLCKWILPWLRKRLLSAHKTRLL